MVTVKSSLTVYFDEPFWVGVCQRVYKGKLEACRIVFGAEPKDYDIYDFFLKNGNRLKFSPPVAEDDKAELKINPKRMQRAVHRQLSHTGAGTKAQQALKLQMEENKQERRAYSRQKTEEEKERQFELRQLKRKQKHKGR